MRFPRILAVLVLVGMVACAPTEIRKIKFDPNVPDLVLKAAAGDCKINPPLGTPMGGYFSENRRVEGIHDDLFARCMVLRFPDGQYLTFVSLDLIGFLRHDVLLVKKEIPDPDRTFFFSTHQHSGPDTLGVFGLGRDDNYMKDLRSKLVKLIKDAHERVVPADIAYGVRKTQGISKNWKDPGVLDSNVYILQVWSMDNDRYPMCRIINFACHPEAFGGKRNRFVSADFPGHLSQADQKRGCTTLYANGALGGMVSVDFAGLRLNERGEEAVKRVAFCLTMGGPTFLTAFPDYSPNTVVKTEIVEIPMENHMFEKLLQEGKIPSSRATYENGMVKTEVSLVTVGGFRIWMIPGEMSPVVAERLPKDPYKTEMIFGLANDEIGYIISEADFNHPRFKQEREKSLGPKTERYILDACKRLAK